VDKDRIRAAAVRTMDVRPQDGAVPHGNKDVTLAYDTQVFFGSVFASCRQTA
jgi:hypothetical protein